MIWRTSTKFSPFAYARISAFASLVNQCWMLTFNSTRLCVVRGASSVMFRGGKHTCITVLFYFVVPQQADAVR